MHTHAKTEDEAVGGEIPQMVMTYSSGPQQADTVELFDNFAQV